MYLPQIDAFFQVSWKEKKEVGSEQPAEMHPWRAEKGKCHPSVPALPCAALSSTSGCTMVPLGLLFLSSPAQHGKFLSRLPSKAAIGLIGEKLYNQASFPPKEIISWSSWVKKRWIDVPLPIWGFPLDLAKMSEARQVWGRSARVATSCCYYFVLPWKGQSL